MASKGNSSAVLTTGETIVSTAIRILGKNGNQPLSPKEIAERGIQYGFLRVPRGRTKTYLSQLLQSNLFNNSSYARKKMVLHTGKGRYKARKNALTLVG